MKRDFGGEAAAYYHRFRHGYPSAVIDVLARAFELTGQDVVVDLGCGTRGVYSAMGSRLPAASQRTAFAEQIRAALAPDDRFSEQVRVTILGGTR